MLKSSTSCQSKEGNHGTEHFCEEPVAHEISVTTVMRHQDDRKAVRTRRLCNYHAKVYRERLKSAQKKGTETTFTENKIA